jgi:general secretion pathway protein I
MRCADRFPLSAAGFTLLEVIVALAVVSLGIIAAFNLIVQISVGSLHMKEKTFAGWIASNEITRLRLSGEFPDVSEFDGDVEFAGSVYRWRATVSETGVDDLRRIDMDVSYADDPDVVIGRSVGFITPAASPRLGGAEWSQAAESGPGAAETPEDQSRNEDQSQDQDQTDDPGQPPDGGDQGTRDSGQ